MPKTAWSTIWYTVRPYRLSLFVMFACIVLANAISFSAPYFFKLITDYAVSVPEGGFDPAVVTPFVLSILLIFTGQELFYRSAHVLEVYLNIRTFDRITTKLYYSLLNRPTSYFEDTFAGQLNRRIDQVGVSLRHFLETFQWHAGWAITGFVVLGTLLYTAHPTLGFAFLIWLVVFLVSSYPLLIKLYGHSQKVWGSSAELSGHLVDSISNVPLVHSFGAVSYEQNRYRSSMDVLLKTMKREGVWAIINRLHQGLSILVLGGTLVIISIDLFSQDQITVGDFVLVASTIPSFTTIIWYVGDIVLDAMRNFSGLSDAVKDLKTNTETVVSGSDTLVRSVTAISFRDLGFVYPGTDAVIFDSFNLTIEAGSKVGVVGSSGAGKSTLIKLLLRNYDPQQGSILIGSQSIQDVPLTSLRENIAFVPQDTTLFHRTLYENILYANPSAKEEAVVQAAKHAHAHEFIEGMPDGYETTVGERGVKLSGGQRQRIAIARAMLKDAPILVLDEATSALDSESEQIIQRGLHELFAGRTVIAVAHRLSTLREMDRIIVIENGQLVEDGTPDELLSRAGGIFKQKWEAQKGGFIS